MASSRSWSIAVSQPRIVVPTSSQEMRLAVMLSWTAEESMMNKKQFRRHSSPTGAKTRGGASTMNIITLLIFGLSTLIRSPPLPLHMQKHHPTPNQTFQDPPITYNPHHHTLPSLSKSPTPLHHQTTSIHTVNQHFLDAWMIILQRHGLLLRVHGAVWMYIRRFDVATRFHLPQKTWSQLHSDLFFLMRHPVILLSFMIVALDQLFWYQVLWHQYNTYCIRFEQGLWNMGQSYSITFGLLQYFETLKHNTSAPELFQSVSFIAILSISAPRQWISCWHNALWASCTTLCAWYYNYMAASSQTLRAWKVNLDIEAPQYQHITHILRAWHPWIHPFYYQGSPLRLLTHLIPQPLHHSLSTHHLYTGSTNIPQSALSVHNHTHLQQNTTASTPEQTLQHHQPHQKQQAPLLQHVDPKHQEPGATHRTPTTPPAITRQQRRRPDHRRTSRTHGQSLIQPPSRLQSQQQSHHHRRVRLALSQHHGLLKKTKPSSASKATPKHARAGLPSAQECEEHLQNARQDGNCSACNRQPPQRLRRRRLLHPLILDRRDLLHLIHSLLVKWDA